MAAKTKGGKIAEERVDEPLDEQELESLYSWVDSIPLSRPKKNITRDFSDGVLVAEMVKHHFPSLVELHNYSSANNSDQKQGNWEMLNRKVFSKMNFELAGPVIDDLVGCKPGMIEKVLLMLQVKIRRAEYGRARQSDKPEADQHQMTPGRKDGKALTRVDTDAIKGRKFSQTKQEKEIKFEPVKKVKFKDEKDIKNNDKGRRWPPFRWPWPSYYFPTLQDQKAPPPKKPSKQPAKTDIIPKRRPGPVVESDVVPRYIAEEKEQEILTREETIQMLQAKITKLEHLLLLKDMRITELTEQLGYAPSEQDYSVYHKQPMYSYKI